MKIAQNETVAFRLVNMLPEAQCILSAVLYVVCEGCLHWHHNGRIDGGLMSVHRRTDRREIRSFYRARTLLYFLLSDK